MPIILILIPSFDNKHTINVTIYIWFDVYSQYQRREREKCQGMYWGEDSVPILEVERMKTKDRRQDVQLIKNQDKMFFTNIYIYIYIIKK